MEKPARFGLDTGGVKDQRGDAMTRADAEFIAAMPKAELHLHIEGTFTVDMKRRFAERNKLELDEKSFTRLEVPEGSTGRALDIQQYKMFLGLYNEGLKVLKTEQDFYELACAYYENCVRNRILYAEVFFDPQPHLDRGIPFQMMMEGLDAARREAARNHGIDGGFIMCINRDLPLDSALAMLDSARPFRDLIMGLGLDSVEDGHPPVKFRQAYDMARSEGYRLTAHCDVDMVNAAEHVRQCIEVLGVSRIDHGINVLDDPRLIDLAGERDISFTACPTWRKGDVAPRRVDRIEKMRKLGLRVSLHTDDPGYFASGYMNGMLTEVARHGALERSDMLDYMRNAFESAWLPARTRNHYLQMLGDFAAEHGLTGARTPH